MPGVPWEWNNPIKECALTGKWRPRIQKWTGKMIVQVQFQNTHYHVLDEQKATSGTTYIWQDATVYDLSLLAAKLGANFDTTPPAGAPAKA